MKKSLVLAALAAATAAPAFAQSSVTIYGRLNVTAERTKIEGQDSEYELNDNASRIGFKGVEDLGGGLKAGFIIEHGFDVSTGQASSTFWGRQSEINLSGNWGMVRLGNFTSEAYYATADYVSMVNHDTGTSADQLYLDANGFNQANKVSYRTPVMGGFWAEVAAMETLPGEDDRGYDAAVNYDAGPLHMGFGYSKLGDAQQFAIRGLYEMGAFTLGGYYQRSEDIIFEGKRNAFRLAGMYTMGATELHLNYGMNGDFGDVDDSDTKQYTVGINQNLSKRTKVYGYYTKVDSSANSPYVERSHFALGVRHNF